MLAVARHLASPLTSDRHPYILLETVSPHTLRPNRKLPQIFIMHGREGQEVLLIDVMEAISLVPRWTSADACALGLEALRRSEISWQKPMSDRERSLSYRPFLSSPSLPLGLDLESREGWPGVRYHSP
jgi:hypothetical protein